jgi:hypothetical protein
MDAAASLPSTIIRRLPAMCRSSPLNAEAEVGDKIDLCVLGALGVPISPAPATRALH